MAQRMCGGCSQPIGRERLKCPCGWVLLTDPLECLAREDLVPRQRLAIELQLSAVAQTGPKQAGESPDDYQRRVFETLERLVADLVKE